MWSLQLVATVRSKQAVRHVAWSPYDSSQAAFLCDDGALHIFTLSQSPMAPAGSSGEVWFSGCLGFMLIACFTLHVLQCAELLSGHMPLQSTLIPSVPPGSV